MTTGDEIVDQNIKELSERSKFGQQKYGTKLTRTDLTTEQWIQHAKEEALDLCNYLERLKRNITNIGLENELNKVKEFNLAFRAGYNESPCLVDLELSKLRHDLMFEENNEYIEACLHKDIIEVADALADELYILLGTILTHGMQDIIIPVFNRIHENNMSKLMDGKPIINGENGVLDETRPLGKVLKPEHYKPVDISDILTK